MRKTSPAFALLWILSGCSTPNQHDRIDIIRNPTSQTASAQPAPHLWQPSAGHVQKQLWPDIVPDAEAAPGPETMDISSDLIGGKTVTGVHNVSRPTITVYQPKEKSTGATVVVIPGGGFEVLAIDLEGTEVCDWLTQTGVTCVVLKYRVPSRPYDWHTHSRPHNLEVPIQALEDVQRTLGLLRLHSAELAIDPKKIGVMGFSAGGYLVAQISNNYKKRLYKPVDGADKENCRPDFAVAVYPGHLWTHDGAYGLNPNVAVTPQTPPTFLLQAEDDDVDGINQSLTYYIALKNAGVSTEMHLYAKGRHAFGLRRTELPITEWPDLVNTWLGTIGMIQNK
jgi:acetyl esterase/lipase